MTIKKITFGTLQDAVEYAKDNGGWIFNPQNSEEVTWYNPSCYTPTPILLESQGSGTLGTYTTFAS